MPAGKQKHPCFPILSGLPVVLFLLLTLTSAGWVFAAGSPFEIEIGDLDRGDAAAKEVKKPHLVAFREDQGHQGSLCAGQGSPGGGVRKVHDSFR